MTRHVGSKLNSWFKLMQWGRRGMYWWYCVQPTPWELDAAIKRVYIPLSEREARTAMAKIHLSEHDFDTLGKIQRVHQAHNI